MTKVKMADPRTTRVGDLKPGQYADGSPLDDIQYLECKIILKTDEFTSSKAFKKYAKLVAQAAAEVGIGFDTSSAKSSRPAIREVMFLDTKDFRLYNNAFILRRRVRFEDGFPAEEPEIVFKFRHPDQQHAALGARRMLGRAAHRQRPLPPFEIGALGQPASGRGQQRGKHRPPPHRPRSRGGGPPSSTWAGY